MKQFSKFDRDSLSELKETLASHFAAYGIKLDMDSIKYSNSTFSAKLKGALTNGKDVATMEQDDWNKRCYRYGLKPDQFGMHITLGGKEYQVRGLHPSRPKYCVKVIGDNGNIMLTTPESLHAAY